MGEMRKISDRVQNIRESGNKIWKQGEYDDLPVLDERSFRSLTGDRKVTEKLSALLIVYGADGTEQSISSSGKRMVTRELPRLGWFHKHEYVEILYVIEGTFTQVLLGEEIQFRQGEFVITDRNCEHADYIEPKDAAVLFLRIRADYLEHLLRTYDRGDELQQFLFHALWRQKKEQSFLEFKRTEQYEPEYLLDRLMTEDLSKEPGRDAIKEGLMIRLLYHLCRDYSIQLHTDSRESREKAVLYELERYIRKNYATVTTKELEQVFHYHRNYFHLLLKKYRGKSFRQYVMEVRMKNAYQMLEQTAEPVKKIAGQVGYENVSHFYHLFEAQFKKTPREVREQHFRSQQ